MMNKLYLKTSEVLQGDFSIKELNLLLVFQVNCPGCFSHALPLANSLLSKYGPQGLNILGLSTAFEDFEVNNIANTRLLLENSQLVGETLRAFQLRAFQLRGLESDSVHVQFPVAFDLLGAGNVIFREADVDSLCLVKRLPHQQEQEAVEQRKCIRDYLFSQSLTPYTFTINRLRGTPSWVLFDQEFNIIANWFAHQPQTVVEDVITQALNGLPK